MPFQSLLRRLSRLRQPQVFWLLLLSRLPFLIYLYPGAVDSDTVTSIEHFFGIREFTTSLSTTDPTIIWSNHHPVIYTLLYGGTTYLGGLVGNVGIAFFCFELLQAALMSYLLARLLRLVSGRGTVRRAWLLVALVAYPIYGFWSAYIVKDALFSAAMLWLMLYLGSIAVTRGRIARSRRFVVKLCAVAMLFMLSKNQCVYILLLTLPYLLWCARRYRARLTLGVAGTMVAYTLLLTQVYPALGIALSGRCETYGFLFQQTARVVRDHHEQVTPAERRAIDAVLPYDALARNYDPNCQDPVKFTYRREATAADYAAYRRTYLAQLRRHPGICAAALWDECDSYFHPTFAHPLYFRQNILAFMRSDADSLLLSKLPRVEPLLEDPVTGLDFVRRHPLLGWPFDCGVLIPAALLLALIGLWRRRPTDFLFALPVVLQIGILIVSPEDGNRRYAMPIVWALPFIAAWAFPPRQRRRLLGGKAEGNCTITQEAQQEELPTAVGAATPACGEPHAADHGTPRYLSVLIPAYNEAEGIATVLEQLTQVQLPGGYRPELIVVDDCSTDATHARALAFRREHPAVAMQVLHHERNRGKGAAVRTALAAAHGAYSVVQDADLEYRPADLATLLGYALREGHDVVFGSRFLRRANKHSYRRYYWGGRLVTAVANVLYRQRLTDEPTCYKLLRTDVLRQMRLQCQGFEFCPEVTAKAARMGYRIPELPISYAPRSFAEGKKITARDGLIAILTLMRYRFTPLRRLVEMPTPGQASRQKPTA